MTELRYPGLDHEPSSGERPSRLFQMLRKLSRAQFGRPTGFLGSIVGHIMARTPSNLERIQWTLSLLDVKPGDRVLEIGIGPGVAVELVSGIATRGFVAGIDHSEEMVRHARRRNADGVRSGRIVLQRASAGDPPVFDVPFDKIFTINSIHFWSDPVECLRRLRAGLRPGGVMAVTLQPRTRSATDATAEVLGGEIADKLRQAGFSSCDVKFRKTASGAMACVLATN